MLLATLRNANILILPANKINCCVFFNKSTGKAKNKSIIFLCFIPLQ